VLEDTDKDTFVRFSEYMYMNDYLTADPEILLSPSEVAPDDQTDDGSGRLVLISEHIQPCVTKEDLYMIIQIFKFRKPRLWHWIFHVTLEGISIS
jgi:hypothetical protein